MGCTDLMPTINPESSIPELIKFIRHSFRECEFDKVQNILVKREMGMKLEMENLVKERDSLTKKLDSLENVQSLTMLEKCDADEKLDGMRKRCEELDKIIVQKEEKIGKLESEKLDNLEKLVCGNRKCEEMDGRLIKLGKELEDLRRHNLNANETIEEMKAKEIAADRIVQELKQKNVEAMQTIDELRAKNMGSDKTAEVVNQLNRRISTSQSILANMLSVNVKDLASLVDGWDDYDPGDTVLMSPEVPAGSDVKDLPLSGEKEIDADLACTNPGSEPASFYSAVAENNATVHDNEGEELGVRGSPTSVKPSGGEVAREKTTIPSSSAGNVVIVISDSDNDNENVPSGGTKKRDRLQDGDDASPSCSRKRRISSCTQPTVLLPCSSSVEESGGDGIGGISDANAVDLVESEDESCSDTYLTHLVENIKSKGQSK